MCKEFIKDFADDSGTAIHKSEGIKYIYDTEILVTIYDVNDHVDFQSYRSIWYNYGDIFMICAAMDDVESVKSIETWMTEIKDETTLDASGFEKPIVIAYTKSDKTQENLTPAEIELGLGIVTKEQIQEIQEKRWKSNLKHQKSFNLHVDT